MCSGIRLKVYSRQGCHLCEEMLAELARYRSGSNFSWDVIDVDDNPSLKREYGDRVPVLCHEDHVVCQHYLDADIFLSYLERQATI